MTRILSLSLWNFRNYRSQTLEFGPKLNVFVGKNGQGKTNCLEALALLIAGRSFRTSFLKELILQGESEFCIEAHFEHLGIQQTLRIEYSLSQKKLLHNETAYTSFVPLIGLLQGVFFSGFQNQLIKGGPSLRRRFLDLQISQIDPHYFYHLRRYHQALKERNVCLKNQKEKALDLYEELMSQSAPYLIERRFEVVQEIEKLTQKKYQELAPHSEAVNLRYATHPSFIQENPITSQDFLKALRSQRKKDLFLKLTTIGPQRDDCLFLLKKQEAKKYASEGQIQTLITALYLAEYQHLLDQSSKTPLFCIDDIGQNLDQERLKKLYDRIQEMGQVFITTPELPSFFQKKACCHLFEVEQGQIKPLQTPSFH